MESCQFPSTYTAISGLLDDVDNSNNEILSCDTIALKRRNILIANILITYFGYGDGRGGCGPDNWPGRYLDRCGDSGLHRPFVPA